MTQENRSTVHGHGEARARLGRTLVELLVDAALTGQAAAGRGLLYVQCEAESLSWAFKPRAECADDIHEWKELESLLAAYDLAREVIVGVSSSGVEFFRLRVAP
jgi:hypothetical protein